MVFGRHPRIRRRADQYETFKKEMEPTKWGKMGIAMTSIFTNSVCFFQYHESRSHYASANMQEDIFGVIQCELFRAETKLPIAFHGNY